MSLFTESTQINRVKNFLIRGIDGLLLKYLVYPKYWGQDGPFIIGKDRIAKQTITISEERSEILILHWNFRPLNQYYVQFYKLGSGGVLISKTATASADCKRRYQVGEYFSGLNDFYMHLHSPPRVCMKDIY